MKVGIMGGTFDPIHNGHLIIAEYSRNVLDLEKVIFIPTGNPPHKRLNRITEKTNRLEMTKLAILTNPSFEFSDLEIAREGITYSIDTILSLKKDCPQDEFYFIIGSDSLFEIQNWKDHDKLLTICNFVVFERGELEDKKISEKIEELKDTYNSNIFKIHCPLIEISSTEIRNRVSTGLSIKYLVPEIIETYIQKYNLYK